MRYFFQLLLFFLPIFSYAQKDTIAHLIAIGGVGIDKAEAIEATKDGGYIVVGSNATNTSGNTDVYLLKVDAQINIEWSTSIGGANNDWGYAVKQTYDKGYIVAVSSNSFGSSGYDAVLMRRDSLGNYLWTKTYGGNDWDFVYDLAITHDSGFVFCGETFNNTAGQSDVFVVKTNKNGDTLWTKTLGGSLIDKGNSIIEASDSNIVVAGLTNTTTDSTQIYVIKLSKTGQLLWDSAYGGSGYEIANAIIETANNEYVIAGTTTSFNANNDKDFYLIRTANNGTGIWQNFFGNPGEEIIYDVVELPIGNLFNVGSTSAAGLGGKDAIIFNITSNGFWASNSSTFGGTNDEIIKSIVLDTSGTMKIAGQTNSFGNGLDDVLIIKVDTVVVSQQSTIDTINDFMTVSIKEPNQLTSLTKNSAIIFPNPSNAIVNIDISNIEVQKIIIISIDGKNVYETITNNNKKIEINLNELAFGTYNVLFYNYNKLVEIQKFIIVNSN